METKRCPRCDSILIEDDDHYSCPCCELYLSAWAYPTLQKVYHEEDDEATAQYPLPFGNQ
jgi:uncharacterized Zn finger protein (UPF0148 family)